MLQIHPLECWCECSETLAEPFEHVEHAESVHQLGPVHLAKETWNRYSITVWTHTLL